MWPKQQPHLKVPAVVSSQVPGKRDGNSSQFKKVQFFVKGKVGMSMSVVRGGPDEILSNVIGTDGFDVYAMVHGKIVNLSSTLSSARVVGDCTVSIRPSPQRR